MTGAARASLRVRVNLGFGIALVALGLMGALSIWAGSTARRRADERQASLLRRDALLRMFSLLQDAETGQRGYILTGAEPYLEPYLSAMPRLNDQRDSVARRYASSPPATRREIAVIDSFTTLRLQRLTTTIRMRRASGLAPLLHRGEFDAGKAAMDSVRAHVAVVSQGEDATRAAIDARADRVRGTAVAANVGLALFAVGFIVFAVWVVNEDITRRMTTENALRESESRLAQILDAMPVAIYVTDGTGRPYFANRASRELLGVDLAVVPREQLAGLFATYVTGTDVPYPADRWPIVRALAGDNVHISDMEIRWPDRALPIEIWASPVRDGDGRIVNAIAVTSDITDRRTAELTIRRAKAAAEAANRAKSDFLARMSHELRTPLNSIIGFSEVLEDETHGPLTERQRKYVRNVLTSGRQLLEQINDILDLSKIEAGRMELSLGTVDPAALIEDARVQLGTLAERKRHDVHVELPADPLPRIVADAARCKQVLYNLLGNAIKYTPEGGRIVVSAAMTRDALGAEWLQVAVRDSGVGIRPEDQERVFGEFERVQDAGYAGQQQGTGLGLALTRRLVELHGGRIRLESEPGRGSTFTVTLPQSGPQRMAVLPGGNGLDTSHVEPAPPSGSGPRVLVVDDDAQAADLLRHHLEAAGYQVTGAATAAAALEMARQVQPDVITLDVFLPDADGLAALAQLKSDPATRHIPVIVVSVTEDRTRAGLGLGAATWFVKPVAREELLREVGRVIGART